MGQGSSALSRKGGQREPVEVTSDETALEKGVVTLSRQRLSLLSKGPCIQESPGGDMLRRYTWTPKLLLQTGCGHGVSAQLNPNVFILNLLQNIPW